MDRLGNWKMGDKFRPPIIMVKNLKVGQGHSDSLVESEDSLCPALGFLELAMLLGV